MHNRNWSIFSGFVIGFGLMILVTAALGTLATYRAEQQSQHFQEAGNKAESSDYALRAQQDAAAWAYGAMWATAIGTVLSAVGVVFIVRTFRQARQTSIRELRAYVGMEKAKVLDILPTGVARAEVRFENFGKTPAFDMVCSWTIGWRPYPFSAETRAERVAKESATESKSAVFPSTGRTLRLSDEDPRAIFAEYWTKGAALVVWGTVWYRDAFDGEQETHFRLFRTHDMLEGVLRYDAAGNSAT